MILHLVEKQEGQPADLECFLVIALNENLPPAALSGQLSGRELESFSNKNNSGYSNDSCFSPPTRD